MSEKPEPQAAAPQPPESGREARTHAATPADGEPVAELSSPLTSDGEAFAKSLREEGTLSSKAETGANTEANTGANTGLAGQKNADGSVLLLTIILWIGVGVAAGAAGYLMISADSRVSLILAGMAAMLVAGFVCAGAFGWLSPALLAGAAIRRAAGGGDAPVSLAGRDSLTAHDLAEKIVDTDDAPLLITKRDGVVVYANRAYCALARLAGANGPLPPRIDRLFSQSGSEAGKIFRLYKAAKSGAALSETLQQTFPSEDGTLVRRRFAVEISPLTEADAFILWRLKLLPVEEEAQDTLAASYADFPRPVFAIENSGAIAWTNAAMRARVGASRGALRDIDDIVLGETAALTRRLQAADGEVAHATVRVKDADPLEGRFTAFRRAGFGEGYVCVELDLDDETASDAAPAVSGDLSEAPFGVAIIEGEFGRGAKIIEANRAFLDAFTGARRGGSVDKCLPAPALEELAGLMKRKGGGAGKGVDATLGDGPDAPTHALYARPVKRKRGEYGPRRAFLYTVDVTDRKRMEADYAQDQKLKAIGFIAGEVAHDFNNLLQVVMSSTEDLMRRHPAGDPAYEDLVLIRQNSQRAANLTKQLLAYSRKQTFTSKVQSVTDLLLDFSRFLDRAVGERVKVKLVNGRALPPVKIDTNQFETAIMNLAVNARDAMAPDGGTLTIRTRHVTADEIDNAKLPALESADHLVIEVADTGPGIPPEIAAKIFDPFFTTKAEGKGTGLGLSTVHGIIGQMGGDIVVENAPEGGAVFRIYLPAHEGAIEEVEAEPAPAPIGALSGSPAQKRILVVEDEPSVRLVVVKALKQAGYNIDFADDGVEALEKLEADASYDLIVTDVMMPEVDGPTMVAEARAKFGARASVLFMSGYAESAIREQLNKVETAHYLQKPFSIADLTDRVRRALYEREQADAA